MTNIIDLPVITRLALDPNRVLTAAIDNLEDVVVIGTTKDGSEWFASSNPDGPKVLWDLERAKYRLLKIVDEYE